MKKIFILIILFLISQLADAQIARFQYISPKPNSILNSRETNLIIRQGSKIESSTIKNKLMMVKGSDSGVHDGKLLLSDDSKTLIFNPVAPFSPNETITIRLLNGIKTVDGKDIGELEFSFKISPIKPNEDLSYNTEFKTENSSQNFFSKNNTSTIKADSFPADFPLVSITNVNNPYEGKIFIANKPAQSKLPYGNYVMIVDTDGTVLKYKKFSVAESNFKILPNGLLAVSDAGRHFVMDTTLAILDTFTCGNGYRTDVHDFQLLPNGHAIVFGDDPQPVDMSLIVPGGRTDAVVTGNVIQELDAEKNVVFQWRTWDYIPITSSYSDLTQKNIDYAHVNAHEVDIDGNLIVTMRLTSNVVKIDRGTGDVLWILGGKENQFTFLNEHESNAPTYFSHGHNASRLPNGNLTLFDNGDLHSPQYSRGVEYEMDEQNKTVKLVWEYRHNPDIYSSSGGNVQRLPNGNTIVCWGRGGASNNMPVFTEVHPDNSIAAEFFYPNGEFSYRSYKFPMGDQVLSPEATAYDVLEGNTYNFNSDTDTTGISIIFNQLNHEMYANAIVTKYNYSPMHPVFIDNPPIMAPAYFKFQGELINSYSGEVHVNLNQYPGILQPEKTIVYVRAQYSEIFTPLSTSYDTLNNELIFTTSDFGEFAFGIPQTVSVQLPFPILPKNNEIVNSESSVRLFWGTRGIVQNYHLQVSTDSAFNNLVIDNSGLTSPTFTMNSVNKDTGYFWRVNNNNSAGTSEWSEIYKFYTASPFINILYPNGSENIYADSTYIIRWQSNVRDTLNIMLLNGEAIISIIADSITSATNAIAWHVPASIKSDTTYKISITSITRPIVTDLSNNSFNIHGLTGISSNKKTITAYQLFQNYPNPFNPSTIINYNLPSANFITLKIYDNLGREIQTLVNKYQNAGFYSINFNGKNLSSGIYYYRLQAGSFIETKKLVLIK